jgi:hypothetical protein
MLSPSVDAPAERVLSDLQADKSLPERQQRQEQV